MKLFYVIVGATPNGRNIEQHDVFFGIAEKIEDLFPEIKAFWKGAKVHIDCWQTLDFVDSYEIKVVPRNSENSNPSQLFFINLGGYKIGFFEEFHEQHIMVGNSMSEVIKRVKKTPFYQNMGFQGAVSHVDNKHGVDIDDIYAIHDLLSPISKEKFAIELMKSERNDVQNHAEIGYLKIS